MSMGKTFNLAGAVFSVNNISNKKVRLWVLSSIMQTDWKWHQAHFWYTRMTMNFQAILFLLISWYPFNSVCALKTDSNYQYANISEFHCCNDGVCLPLWPPYKKKLHHLDPCQWIYIVHKEWSWEKLTYFNPLSVWTCLRATWFGLKDV